jgi:hypothetical protein
MYDLWIVVDDKHYCRLCVGWSSMTSKEMLEQCNIPGIDHLRGDDLEESIDDAHFALLTRLEPSYLTARDNAIVSYVKKVVAHVTATLKTREGQRETRKRKREEFSAKSSKKLKKFLPGITESTLERLLEKIDDRYDSECEDSDDENENESIDSFMKWFM